MNIRPRGGKFPQSLLDLPLQLRAQLPAGKAEAEILRRRIRQLLHTLLNAPFPVLQGQIYHIGFSWWVAPNTASPRLICRHSHSTIQLLPILESPAKVASPSERTTVDEHFGGWARGL